MLNQILEAVDGLGLDRAGAVHAFLSGGERLDIVKRLLGYEGPEQDDILRFVIQAVEGMILRYINHKTLPGALQNVLIVMAVSYYKSAGLGTTDVAVGPVSSVKRGDVQTSFAVKDGASGAAGTFNLGAESGDFFGWKTVLNEYRKLGW